MPRPASSVGAFDCAIGVASCRLDADSPGNSEAGLREMCRRLRPKLFPRRFPKLLPKGRDHLVVDAAQSLLGIDTQLAGELNPGV